MWLLPVVLQNRGRYLFINTTNQCVYLLPYPGSLEEELAWWVPSGWRGLVVICVFCFLVCPHCRASCAFEVKLCKSLPGLSLMGCCFVHPVRGP